MLEFFRQKTENKEEKIKNSFVLDGVTFVGRPEPEVKEKWEKEKSYYGIDWFNQFDKHQKEFADVLKDRKLILSINSDGQVKIIDGNTRLFGVKNTFDNIPYENISVSYSAPEGEFVGTLADVLAAAKKIQNTVP